MAYLLLAEEQELAEGVVGERVQGLVLVGAGALAGVRAGV